MHDKSTRGGGEREQKVRPGPGVTSGLSGRGDLRRKNAVADPKQTKGVWIQGYVAR